jgi:tetratricopeptide (TPR) repeat protein
MITYIFIKCTLIYSFILKTHEMPKLFTIKSIAVFIVALLSTNIFAQGVITTPRTPSPAASVTQTIGISTVTVNYSRPSVRGRKIWDSLVPYGYNVQGFGAGNRAPWRAGANENTTITFSNDAKVQGQPVPAGEYGLFFVINSDNAGEVILSKDYKSWGSFWYDSTHDFLRANIQIRDVPVMAEMLTYDFINDDKNYAELVLNWEKKQFPVKIEFDVDKIVMDNAVEQLKNTVGFSWQGYASAANYALQNNTNLDQAVVWANQAVTQNRNFTTLNLKSRILKAQGNADEAAKTMDTAIQLSTENELNLYAYGLMNQQQADKAIEMFLLNTKRHPESANVWDSLGEGYFTKGDKKNAIASFKKSLSMNPPAPTKANSEKFLKQMGAM